MGLISLSACVGLLPILQRITTNTKSVLCDVGIIANRLTPSATFWATVCKTVRTILSDRCQSVCDVGVMWPNGWMN